MYKKHTLNIPLADSCHFFLYHSTCEIKIETPLKKKKKRRLKDGRQDNARTVGRERKTTGGRNCFLPLKKQLLRFFFSFFFFFFLMPQLLLHVYGKRESVSTGNQQNQIQTIPKQESLLWGWTRGQWNIFLSL